jgi:hypothetical protein
MSDAVGGGQRQSINDNRYGNVCDGGAKQECGKSWICTHEMAEGGHAELQRPGA